MAHFPAEDAENTHADLLQEITDLRKHLDAANAHIVEAEALQCNLRERLAATEAVIHDPLRKREQQALLILNEMYQFVALLDAQGNELETNQTSLDAVGLRRAECIGHPFWDIPVWPDSILDTLRASFQQVMMTGKLIRFEVEFFIPEKDEELLTTDITLKPICNREGDVVFVVLEGRDITERKRAEAEITQKNAELQTLYDQVSKLDQLKSLFFAMMNHELRTPLTLILGPTEALLQKASLPPEVHHVLEMVTRNGRFLLKLVNDLLEVSRLEQGKLELHYTICDLTTLVQRLAANFETAAAQRHLTYIVQTPPQMLVEIDSARIERVLLNLLSNAFKFTPDGGSILCHVGEVPPSEKDTEMPIQVVLSVQDSGPGVPGELREMIFERFRQTEEGAKRRFGGTGLGLTIVKDFVELHQGTIVIDETPGGGARFTIHLPQHAPEGTHVRSEEEIDTSEASSVRMTRTAVEEVQPTGQRGTEALLRSANRGSEERSLILVVEDHTQMRQFLVEQLTPHYRVAEAENGQEGMALIRELHPNLVLTDIMMPMMSGEEMLAELRADAHYDDILVVILSARGNEEMRLHLLRHGAQDYLVKPFSPEELKVRLDNLLTLQQTRTFLQRELLSSQQGIGNLISELAARKRLLEVTNSDLQMINKQQSDFIAIVSHEFRTALTGIEGFSELLCEQEWSPEEVREYASDITADARRLTRMINDVLDLERMKSGKMTLHYQWIDINALLQDLAHQTQRTTPKHTFRCQLDETISLIEGDHDKMIQVLSNLLSNAVKYAPAGGDIVLRSQQEQGSIHCSIQDWGSGIPEEALEYIFTPYTRMEIEHTRYIHGTGLGLSVVREILALHGGRIWVESNLGHGSTFHFSLPLMRAISDASQTQQREAQRDGHS